jgi:rubrerythrin
MNIEQAIETAIQYETRVRDIYRLGSKGCNDETGSGILGVLADEEQQHLDYLSEKLTEWKQTGRVTPAAVKTIFPSRQDITESLKKLESRVSGADCTNDAELLKQALKAELETSNFYKQMVSELDEQGQALFEPFVEIEDGHLTIVQAELDNLMGLGYWFDYKEFDLEAG